MRRNIMFVVVGVMNISLYAQTIYKNDTDTLILLANQFVASAQAGNTDDAISYGTRLIDCWDALSLEKDTTYCNFSVSVSYLYSSIGEYGKSILYRKALFPVIKKIYGEHHSIYGTFLNNLASDYAHIGNYQDAIKFGKDALKIKEKLSGKSSQDYARCLILLACYYADSADYSEAIRRYKEALDIFTSVS